MPPINDSVQGANYKDYHNDNRYDYRTGRLVIPCCNGSPLVIQVHQPYSIRTQTFSAVKERTPPVLPAPEPENVTNSNVTLIDQAVVIPMPTIMGDGANTYKFAAAGTYQYLEASPTTPTTGYPAGRAPWWGAGIEDALGAIIGGIGSLPFALTVPFSTGLYGWPYTNIGPQFWDSTLSAGRGANGGYTLDELRRG